MPVRSVRLSRLFSSLYWHSIRNIRLSSLFQSFLSLWLMAQAEFGSGMPEPEPL